MRKLIWLLIFLPLQLFAQYNWTDLPNAPKSWRCDDMFFLNSKLGWVTHAYYGEQSVKQFGQVYKTRDGGSTWQLISDSSKTFYRAIGFADSLTGWIGNLADTNKYGSATAATPDTVILYQTNDGGNTWQPIYFKTPHPVAICGITVASDSVIYAYGRWDAKWTHNNVGYEKSVDKGKTWVYHDMSAYFFGMVDGWFFNKDTGFITGAGLGYKAQILYTVDGGNTWQISYKSGRADTDEVWKIFFPSRYVGYASIEYQQAYRTITKRYFVKTTDGGKTWSEMPFINSYDEEGIGFINDTIGWIGGDYYLPNYVTFDGGNNWAPDKNFGVPAPPYQYSSTGFAINRFRKLNDTLIYACGATVYKLSGSVTSVNNLKSQIAEMAKNYPNPYSAQTTIKYSLSEYSDNVNLEILGALGQLVFSAELGPQSPGAHEYLLKNGLPDGAYFYKIIAGTTTIVNRMVRVK